jgi:hypothetical protein
MIRKVIALATLLVASEARAQQHTGNEIYEICRLAPAKENGLCLGYVMGVIETWEFARDLFKFQHEPPWCWPDGVDYEQLVDIVTAQLRDHPETRHLSAVLLVWQALAERFPC